VRDFVKTATKPVLLALTDWVLWGIISPGGYLCTLLRSYQFGQHTLLVVVM